MRRGTVRYLLRPESISKYYTGCIYKILAFMFCNPLIDRDYNQYRLR